MEQKKKTIIWETNTEPPKNYFWVKEDGKVYEFDFTEWAWVESKEIQLCQEESEETEPEENPEENPTTGTPTTEEPVVTDPTPDPTPDPEDPNNGQLA